ncbi:FAD-dependent monooxygenase [Streptomyces spectabilis]|uniref:3-hydroxybenzoate 6-monooxygenase n=1 Tax=Streptomyces spectabilis TaxID=68270 RepID=A0A5P2XFR6_STRST|nr:FAD-dependent monooxygenase [Streptomyces spectabilis]MBB5104522.1 salicylate hydroxylase [Streptomyces spectabilis]MCI3905123.1 FAD-dependent monooxygenase [Streptomyces spectabilis]QEV62139.1 3-hydroxybenzoate 6-monooxygenase [Streptomyces spectabilis]GGV00495.1 putative monooxygenase (salicylate/ hydroxybenzoate hydroxylase [Streptomyces spectabilis]
MTTVVVAGGGIGGLATALSVSAHGHRVVVCERGEEFAELGAGIQLAPNGMHALDRLGLAGTVGRIAVPVEELRFMDGVTGDHVVSMPLGEEYRRRFRNAYVVVHRGELYRTLLRACQDSDLIELRASCPVVGYEHGGDEDAPGVRVLLGQGRVLTADALVGADGLHSAVRAKVVGDGAPRNAGITVYRSIVPMERVPEDLRHRSVSWWTGPGRHFVHYPIAGGRYLNLAPSVENRPSETFSGLPVPAADVRAQFAVLCDTARRLLALGTDWKAWVLVDREPVREWTDGRVALLGDAAHPMLHYAAQGACMALEDAVVIGELLNCPPRQFGARLRQYNASRRERTARVHRLARDSIRLWHARDADARARNETLAAMSATDLYDYVAWLHGARDFAPPSGSAEGTYTLAGYLGPADSGGAADDPAAPHTLGGSLELPEQQR